jgi:hypothetical protein
MIDHCLACQSREIAKGGLTNGASSRTHPLAFKPDGLKFLTMTDRSGTPIEFYACRSCGLVWTATDPEALRTFMDKYCEKE